jgi:hypothetical protein
VIESSSGLVFDSRDQCLRRLEHSFGWIHFSRQFFGLQFGGRLLRVFWLPVRSTSAVVFPASPLFGSPFPRRRTNRTAQSPSFPLDRRAPQPFSAQVAWPGTLSYADSIFHRRMRPPCFCSGRLQFPLAADVAVFVLTPVAGYKLRRCGFLRPGFCKSFISSCFDFCLCL